MIASLQHDAQAAAQGFEQRLKQCQDASEAALEQHKTFETKLQQELEHKGLLLRNRDIELEALKQGHGDVLQRNQTLERLVSDLQEDKAFWRNDTEQQVAKCKQKVADMAGKLEQKEKELSEQRYWTEAVCPRCSPGRGGAAPPPHPTP